MSEIKLDVVVETAQAAGELDAFTSNIATSFEGAKISADTAAESVSRLTERIAAIPQISETRMMVFDDATPALQSIRAELEAIPAEKWITIRTRYESPQPGGGGPVYEPEGTFAVGLDRAPRDMLAMIHKDEAVLPPEEAGVYRELKESGLFHGTAQNPIQIQNLNIVSLSGPGGQGGGREFTRRKMAPELFRYIRRSGRFNKTLQRSGGV